MASSAQRRIQYAKNHGARISDKGKNDTVVARPLIVQLDSETIKAHADTWLWDIIGILEEMFGRENITGFSVHRDETNVHMHVLFVPCHEQTKEGGKIKCALSQTKFFTSPKQLAGMHKHIRKKLMDKGYDIQMDNKPIEQQLAGYYDKQGVWHQQGLTPDQLKAITERNRKLDKKEREIMLSQKDLKTLADTMDDIQKRAYEAQTKLENSMRVFARQQIDFENEKVHLQRQLKVFAEEKQKLKKLKEQTDGMLERVRSVSNVCRKIIEDEHNLNDNFLDFLDRCGRQNNRDYRTFVISLYREFDKQEREKRAKHRSEFNRLMELYNRSFTAENIVEPYREEESKDDDYSFC